MTPLPLWSAWVIYFGMIIVLLPVFWFIPIIEHLDPWQKFLSAVVFASIIMNFVFPLLVIKKSYEWAYILLVVLTLIFPILFVGYRFSMNITRIPSMIEN